MPSEVPRERLQDIVTKIDRVRAHLKGMEPGAELDDKTRDAVERCLERICVNELAVRGDDDGAGRPRTTEHSLRRPGANMTELVFLIEDAPEGGHVARALGASIVTEADDLPALREAIRDSVRCHFDAPDVPLAIRLHLVRDEVIAA